MKRIITGRYLISLLIILMLQLPAMSQGRYFHLKGEAGSGNAVTADLIVYGERISGYFSNPFREGKPCFLSGEIAGDGSMQLFHNSSDEAVISGILGDDGSFTGKWIDDSKEHAVQLTEIYDDGAQLFSVAATESVQPLNEAGGSPVAAFGATFPTLSGENNKQASAILNDLALKELFREKVSGEPSAMLKNMETAFFGHYRNSNAGIDIEKNYLKLNWEKRRLLNVAFNEHGTVCLAMHDYTYTGGSSGGLEICRTLTFDVGNGKKVLLSDLLAEGSEKALSGMIRNAVCDAYDIDPEQQLTDYGFFSNELPLPQNYLLTNAGLTFTYNVYEVAGQETGPVSIFLPFSQLKSILNPANPVIERLKLKF